VKTKSEHVVAATLLLLPTKKQKYIILNINIGPLSINTHSIKIKPKFDFGAQIAGTGITFGLGDIRNGIDICADADITKQTLKGGGKNIEEFLRSLEFEGRIAEVLNQRIHFQKIIQFFTNILAETSKMFRLRIFMWRMWMGYVLGRLGRVPEQEYRWVGRMRMMGASVVLAVGGEYRVGVHESRQKIKPIFGLAVGGASFRFVLYVRRKETDMLPVVASLSQTNDKLEAECVGYGFRDVNIGKQEVILHSNAKSAILGKKNLFRSVLYVRRKETDGVPAIVPLPQTNDGSKEAECATRDSMISEILIGTEEVIPSTVDKAILGKKRSLFWSVLHTRRRASNGCGSYGNTSATDESKEIGS
jgi:hypothetical protein